ncbi:hypothetical protein NGB36_29030 [Streptomyces sp. RB6PN25]|uniref:Uncharacterized protein n=1 Tax=Streptomyces humicola TaxID=2953240 RepID=A0ABT1Q3L3_9ACTN|nr:hypothetical protein [Streptomyces humicola]MCQ4084508.1 hypothetical protein [Streptomyces humicola]
MQSNGVEPRGHVLLIGGADVVHRRRLQWSPTAGLAALAGVPAATLAGGGQLHGHLPVDTVAVQAARDANEVLTRLRSAAAVGGPLLVYLAGPLVLDRKRGELHLALAGTTADTVRYTALPWSWLRDELRLRATASTTLVVDLVADAHAWRMLHHRPDTVGAGLPPMCGVVAAPDGSDAEPARYTRCLAELLRSSPQPLPVLQLHAAAVAAARPASGTLLIPAAQPALPVRAAAAPASRADASGHADPRPLIWQAAQAGRHNEAASMAAAWEQHAWRTYGPTSTQASEWLEIRADLARIAGNLVLATELWIAAAKARLGLHGPDSRRVAAAARSAHWCWNGIGEPSKAVEIGPHLIALLEQLPGLDPRQLPTARRRLESLAAGYPRPMALTGADGH